MAASATPCTDLLRGLLPPFLSAPWGARWATAVGGVFDKLVVVTRFAVKARMPLHTPADALDDLGWERQILRVPGESDDAYRLRVHSAWETWRWAGTDNGIVRAFEALGWAIGHLEGASPNETTPLHWITYGRADLTENALTIPDGDMQLVGLAHWGIAGSDTSIAKVPGDTPPDRVLTVLGSMASGLAYAFQGILQAGHRYRAQVDAKAGSAPSTYALTNGDSALEEGNSSAWTTLSREFVARNPRLGLGVTGTGGSISAIFDDLTATELSLLGHVWIMADGDWKAPDQAEYWSRFWVVLDYRGHVTETVPVLFLFGGLTWDGVDFTAFNDTWQCGADLLKYGPTSAPSARCFGACAQLGDLIVLFGGTNFAGAYYGDTWEWNPLVGNWTRYSPDSAPEPRYGATLTELGGNLYLYGGQSSSIMSDVWRYDRGTGWYRVCLEALPGARKHHTMAALGGKLVLFGGQSVSGPEGSTWVFTLATERWEEVTGSVNPGQRFHHASAVLGGKVLIFGGLHYSTALGDTWEFDGARWTQKTPAHSPPARYGHAMARVGEYVYLYGGAGDPLAPVPLVDCWRWDGVDWTQVSVPTAIHPGGTMFATSCAFAPRKVAQSWDEGWAWDDGSTWSSALTDAEVAAMRQSIAKWKGSHARCDGILLNAGDSGWSGIWGGEDPGFWAWDDGTVWDSSNCVGLISAE